MTEILILFHNEIETQKHPGTKPLTNSFENTLKPFLLFDVSISLKKNLVKYQIKNQRKRNVVPILQLKVTEYNGVFYLRENIL